MPAKESSSVHVKVSKILPHPSAVSRARVTYIVITYSLFVCFGKIIKQAYLLRRIFKSFHMHPRAMDWVWF